MQPVPSARCVRLLLVDNDRLSAAPLGLGLQAAGHQVRIASSAAEALALLDQSSFDLAILDDGLPDGAGLALAPLLRERYRLPFLFLSACDHGSCVDSAIGEGALAYLVKPVDISQLLPMLATALARGRELAGLRDTREQLQSALDQERDVSIAIGIVMARSGLARPEAFEFLRRAARSSRRKMADVAHELIETRGLTLKLSA